MLELRDSDFIHVLVELAKYKTCKMRISESSDLYHMTSADTFLPLIVQVQQVHEHL